MGPGWATSTVIATRWTPPRTGPPACRRRRGRHRDRGQRERARAGHGAWCATSGYDDVTRVGSRLGVARAARAGRTLAEWRTARRRRVSEPLALAMAAAVLTALIVWLAPPGTDFAAHAYQRSLFARQGFGIWDNGWYAGATSSSPTASSTTRWPRRSGSPRWPSPRRRSRWRLRRPGARRVRRPGRWASRTFAVVWPAFVLTAAFPSALGMMLALLALLALQRGRTALACATCALTWRPARSPSCC